MNTIKFFLRINSKIVLPFWGKRDQKAKMTHKEKPIKADVVTDRDIEKFYHRRRATLTIARRLH